MSERVAGVESEAWLRRLHPSPDAAVRLVCLPHAGGSASFFFPLSRNLAPDVEVVAVQYPGRQDRHREPVVDDLGRLADQVAAVLSGLPPGPLALLGHSMGATLAFEVALRMRRAGMPAPVRLFASGRRAPSRHRDERVHERDDAGVVAEVRALSGPHANLLADPEVLEMLMPALRGDYRAIELYRHDTHERLDCPITVFTGDRDPKVSVDEASAWRSHTTGPVDVHTFPGGHFFLIDHAAAMLALIRERIT